MSSFAVWYKRKSASKESRSEADSATCTNASVATDIHVNLWESNICGRDDSSVYFDFGLMIEDVRDIENIYMYCPFEVNKSDVKDLGKCILDNQSLVGAIFNENYRICSGEPRRLLVQSPAQISHQESDSVVGDKTCLKKEEEKGGFVIYSLDIVNDLDVKHIDDGGYKGTRLKITIEKILMGKYGGSIKKVYKYYFRLRVAVKMSNLKLIFQRAKTISPFQSAFITTQVIDFRLNDLRSCTPLVRDEFAKGDHFSIRKIHYLLLRKTTDVFIHQGGEVSSRLLEKHLWESYISGLENNIVAYHFKKKTGNTSLSSSQTINDYSILTRFEFECINFRKILAYLYIVLYLGVVSEGATTLLEKLYPTELFFLCVGVSTFLFCIIIVLLYRERADRE